MTEASAPATSTNEITYKRAVRSEDLAECFPLIAALRPTLENPADWIDRATQLGASGYRIVAAWAGAEVIALAGYRILTNLFHGRFLYVDDLVTAPNRRGEGHGAGLLDELARIGRHHECARLVLDTGVANLSAQRFYIRQGLTQFAVGFMRSLT